MSTRGGTRAEPAAARPAAPAAARPRGRARLRLDASTTAGPRWTSPEAPLEAIDSSEARTLSDSVVGDGDLGDDADGGGREPSAIWTHYAEMPASAA